MPLSKSKQAAHNNLLQATFLLHLSHKLQANAASRMKQSELYQKSAANSLIDSLSTQAGKAIERTERNLTPEQAAYFDELAGFFYRLTQSLTGADMESLVKARAFLEEMIRNRVFIVDEQTAQVLEDSYQAETDGLTEPISSEELQ